MAVDGANWWTLLEAAQAVDEEVWLRGASIEEAAKAWAAFGEEFAKLWPATRIATHSFEGLLAVLNPKRPRHGPPKLCIDGHAYHRRQRNRVKRKR